MIIFVPRQNKRVNVGDKTIASTLLSVVSAQYDAIVEPVSEDLFWSFGAGDEICKRICNWCLVLYN